MRDFTMARGVLLLVVIAFFVLAPNLCGVLVQETDYISSSAFRADGEHTAIRRALAVQEQTTPEGEREELLEDIPQCGPSESCAGRCGSPANESESHRCFCDPGCMFYRDCCMDFDELCSDVVPEGTRQQSDGELLSTDHFFPTTLATPEEYTVDDVDDTTSRSNLGFQCVEVEEFSEGAVWMKATCDPTWTDLYMQKLCTDVSSGDMLARLPVQGNDGFTYRNMYCAQCNFAIVNVIYWVGVSACYGEMPPDAETNMAALASYLRTKCHSLVDEPKIEDVPKPRFCLKNVDWCNARSASRLDRKFRELVRRCKRAYQRLVRGQRATGDIAIYKNPFCALCNGIQKHEMSCDVPPLTRYSEDVSYYDYFVDAETLHTRTATVELEKPDFVVVTNFNFRNGSNVMILRTDGSNGLLPVHSTCPDNMVYDPYIGDCRSTYCAVGYTMNNNQCVRQNLSTDDPETPGLFNSSVQMTFSITVSVRWFVKDDGVIDDQNALIPPTANDTGFNFTDHQNEISMRKFVIERKNLTMDLSEILEFQAILDQTSQNVTLDDAAKFWLSLFTVEVQALQVRVAGKVFNIAPENIENFINSLKGNMGELASFLESCPDGVKNVYHTNQLQVNDEILGDGCIDVYIKSTNTCYECSNWLFLKTSDPSNKSPGGQYMTAVVCEDDPAVLDPSCLRIQYGASDCLQDNETVVCSNGKQYGPGEYERAADGTIFVCNDLDNVIETKYVVHFNFTRAQDIIAICGVGLSTTCHSVTLFTYAMFKELRTLPGMNLMTLVVILLINDWSFLFGLYATDTRTLCQAMGVFLHFICLCQFFWVNIIAYDVYKTFGRKRLTKINANTSQRKQYLRYALYAWGMPVIIVAISAALDFCDCTILEVDYGMYFTCWISDPAAYALFFGIPMLLTNTSNLIMFVVTVCNLRRYHHKSAVISGNANTHNHFALCAKLATVMGFAWNIAFFASILHNSILWYFFFIFYFLQGVFVFLSYIANRRVYRMYLKRFGRDRLSSVNIGAHSNGRSRPPSVASQAPIAAPSPKSSIPSGLANDLDLPNQPSYRYLPDFSNQLSASLNSTNKCVGRQKSHSCSVSHISYSENVDSVVGTVFENAGSRKRRASFSSGADHHRTNALDGGASTCTSTSTVSGAAYTYALEMGQFELGAFDDAYLSSDESSNDDDVFQPAYHFTVC